MSDLIKPPTGVVVPPINNEPPSEFTFYSKPILRGGGLYKMLDEQNYNDLREVNGMKQIKKNYPQQNYPQQNYPQQNYPQQNYPQQNYPQQNYPPNLNQNRLKNNSSTLHRVNAIPQDPSYNVHKVYRPPPTGPTEGIYKDVPAFGHTPPMVGRGYVTDESDQPQNGISTKRFIKNGYGSYKGTGLDNRGVIEAQNMHNYTSTPLVENNYDIL